MSNALALVNDMNHAELRDLEAAIKTRRIDLKPETIWFSGALASECTSKLSLGDTIEINDSWHGTIRGNVSRIDKFRIKMIRIKDDEVWTIFPGCAITLIKCENV